MMARGSRRTGSSRWGSTGFVSIATVLAVVASVLVLLVGSSEKSGVLDLLNGHTWLRDREAGTLSLVNDSSGEVEFNLKLTDRVGHDVAITQNGRIAVALDRNTKTYAAVDLARYELVDPQEAPDARVDIVAVDRDVYVIDRTNGKVERRDGTALGTVRGRLDVGRDLTRGVVDDEGNLWVADQRDGLLKSLAYRNDRLKLRTTLKIASKDAELDLGLFGGTPAVLVVSDEALVFIDGTEVSAPVNLPLQSGELPRMPREVSGDLLPISVNDTGKIVLVRRRAPVVVNLPDRRGAQLGEPVVFGDRIYVPDERKGDVIVLDRNGDVMAAEGFMVRQGSGPIDVVLGNGVIYFQSADGATAVQINADGQRVEIFKANPTIPTNDEVLPVAVASLGEASIVRPPAPSGDQLIQIEPRPPGEPVAPVAQAGARKIDLSWGAAPERGTPVTGYVITWAASKGAGGSKTIDAQTSTTIGNLVNGVTYTMSVKAQSAAGPSNAAAAPPAIPSSTIPDTPTGVAAKANKDGTISVSWTQADDGTGKWVQYYDVMAAGMPTKTVSGAATAVTLAAADGIVVGTSYTFTVKSRLSPTGAVSPASQPSSAVRSHRPPDAPTGFQAALTASGEVTLSWAPCTTSFSACAGGETITGYQLTNVNTGVTTPLAAADVQAKVPGLSGGTSYQFALVASNAVGTSTPSSAQAVAYTSPTVSITRVFKNGYQSLGVDYTVSTGGTANVGVEFWVNGIGRGTGQCPGACSTSIGSLGWGTSNSVVVKVTNPLETVSSSAVSNTTSPAPSISIRWGASAEGLPSSDGGSCLSSCKHIDVTITNIWPSNATVALSCENNVGGWHGWKNASVQVDGIGNYSGQSGCYFGYTGYVVAITMGTGAGNFRSNELPL